MNHVALAVFPLSLAFAGVAFAAVPSTSGAASPAAVASQPTVPHHRATVSYRRDTPLAERMTRSLNILEANGYGGFTNFRADGKNFAATVTEQGQPFSVVVDPDTDQVSRS